MDLSKIDRELVFINKKAQPSNPTPVNFEEEKKKMMKDRFYNPQFKYSEIISNLLEAEKRLKKLKPDNSVFGRLLKQKIEEFTTQINLIKNYGKPLFTNYSIKWYKKPSPELVNKAKELLKLEYEDSSVAHTTISAVKKFTDILKEYGLKYKVIERELIVGANFDIAHQMLYINKNKKFTEHEIRRLIVHEIKTHILRSENGKKQRYKLFIIGFPYYLITEEGLAVYNEEKEGFLTNDVIKRYAGRVIAIDLALKNSFSYVYNYLLEYFDKEEAFLLTSRAKRGLSDTSRPGAFTKDHLYLSGYYPIKNFVKSDGNINKLYIGKIGTEHVRLLNYI
ncbi:MAG: tyrosine/phenylalanine carboxypeptidase domain-containing protein [Nanoarchaeota archaeon]